MQALKLIKLLRLDIGILLNSLVLGTIEEREKDYLTIFRELSTNNVNTSHFGYNINLQLFLAKVISL